MATKKIRAEIIPIVNHSFQPKIQEWWEVWEWVGDNWEHLSSENTEAVARKVIKTSAPGEYRILHVVMG